MFLNSLFLLNKYFHIQIKYIYVHWKKIFSHSQETFTYFFVQNVFNQKNKSKQINITKYKIQIHRIFLFNEFG